MYYTAYTLIARSCRRESLRASLCVSLSRVVEALSTLAPALAARVFAPILPLEGPVFRVTAAVVTFLCFSCRRFARWLRDGIIELLPPRCGHISPIGKRKNVWGRDTWIALKIRTRRLAQAADDPHFRVWQPGIWRAVDAVRLLLASAIYAAVRGCIPQ